MTYAVYDLHESLKRADLPRDTIKTVEAAWGGSPEGCASWEGGFLLHLKDNRWAYLSGWCDTTGWGCQDGYDVSFFTARPELASLASSFPKGTEGDPWQRWEKPAMGWDEQPEDLNRYVRGEIDEFYYD